MRPKFSAISELRIRKAAVPALVLGMTAVILTAASVLLAAPPLSDQEPAALTVHVRDYCDPGTFPAGKCARPTDTGLITFPAFNAELAADKSAGAWRFAPDRAETPENTPITLQNLGGETHTFTRVKEFGGGFNARLNGLSGNPDPAPECAAVVNGALVPQPPSADNVFLPAGVTVSGPSVANGETARFQCCIHPWMRATINPNGEHQH